MRSRYVRVCGCRGAYEARRRASSSAAAPKAVMQTAVASGTPHDVPVTGSPRRMDVVGAAVVVGPGTVVVDAAVVVDPATVVDVVVVVDPGTEVVDVVVGEVVVVVVGEVVDVVVGEVVVVVVGGVVVVVVGGVVVVVVVLGGGHTMSVTSVAKAPAVNGSGKPSVYKSAISTLSSTTSPQSAGSFGMVTWKVPVHGVFGTRVSPSLMTAPPAVQLMSTTAPPGTGLCSVSSVTTAGKSPVFATAKLQVTVVPIVAVSPGQFLNASAPVPGSWACAGVDVTSVPTPTTSANVRSEWPRTQYGGHRFRPF